MPSEMYHLGFSSFFFCLEIFYTLSSKTPWNEILQVQRSVRGDGDGPDFATRGLGDLPRHDENVARSGRHSQIASLGRQIHVHAGQRGAPRRAKEVLATRVLKVFLSQNFICENGSIN